MNDEHVLVVHAVFPLGMGKCVSIPCFIKSPAWVLCDGDFESVCPLNGCDH